MNSTFENPSNGHRELAGTEFSWLWCLLFGPFYFLYKGVWSHAGLWFLVAVVTYGIGGFVLLLVYPFLARTLVDRHYLKRGWKPALA